MNAAQRADRFLHLDGEMPKRFAPSEPASGARSEAEPPRSRAGAFVAASTILNDQFCAFALGFCQDRSAPRACAPLIDALLELNSKKFGVSRHILVPANGLVKRFKDGLHKIHVMSVDPVREPLTTPTSSHDAGVPQLPESKVHNASILAKNMLNLANAELSLPQESKHPYRERVAQTLTEQYDIVHPSPPILT